MFNIIIKETKELFADKKIWLGILTVLIIIIIGTSYNIRKTEKPASDILRLGVINNDKSTYSDLLLDYFTGSRTFSSLVSVTSGDEQKIKQAFQNGELDIYLEIPKDFAENMMRIEHSPINVTLNIKDTTKAILFENVLKSYEKYITAVEVNAVGLYEIMQQEGMDQKLVEDTNREISLELIFTALGKETFFSFKPVSQFPTTSLMFYYISSIVVISILYFGLYVGFQILREMKQGTFTRLRTTRTPLYQFLIAKMSIIILLLTAVIVAALYLLRRKPLSAADLLFCLAVSMFGVSLSAFLSALLPTTQRFILAGNLLIFYIAVLGGGIIPIQFLPQDMLILSKITPFYYILKGILSINQGQYWNVRKISLDFLMISFCLLIFTVILFRQRSVLYDEV